MVVGDRQAHGVGTRRCECVRFGDAASRACIPEIPLVVDDRAVGIIGSRGIEVTVAEVAGDGERSIGRSRLRIHGHVIAVRGPIVVGNEQRDFWTTEADRELPSDGDLEVAVALSAAQWMEVQTEEKGGAKETTWKPVGDVSGLPSRSSAVLTAP